MKKFFAVVPLQGEKQLTSGVYRAVGNDRLQMDRPTRFPVIPAINGYVAPGEAFRLIVLAERENVSCARNLALLREELAAVCAATGAFCPAGVETIEYPADQSVSVQAETFSRLIGYVEDDDELFACMTYGTKPMPIILTMVMKYAYRIKQNASIGCLFYGQIDRNSNGAASIYDMTALVQLDEIVRLLAEQGVTDPKSLIESMLSMQGGV